MSTAVYFDLDGTLLTYDEPFFDQFVAAIDPYCPPADETRNRGIERAYEAYVDRLFAALRDCEAEPYRLAYEAVLETIDLEADSETLARAHCERELAASTVNEGAKRVVQRAAITGPTGILTNGSGAQQRAKLERHGLDDLVDAVVVSNEEGVRKPDPAIFEAAIDRLPADEYVYVGDSYEEDIVGARAVGFETVYVAGSRADEADAAVGNAEADDTTAAAETAADVATPADTAADAVVATVEDLLEADSLPASMRGAFAPPKS